MCFHVHIEIKLFLPLQNLYNCKYYSFFLNCGEHQLVSLHDSEHQTFLRNLDIGWFMQHFCSFTFFFRILARSLDRIRFLCCSEVDERMLLACRILPRDVLMSSEGRISQKNCKLLQLTVNVTLDSLGEKCNCWPAAGEWRFFTYKVTAVHVKMSLNSLVFPIISPSNLGLSAPVKMYVHWYTVIQWWWGELDFRRRLGVLNGHWATNKSMECNTRGLVNMTSIAYLSGVGFAMM